MAAKAPNTRAKYYTIHLNHLNQQEIVEGYFLLARVVYIHNDKLITISAPSATLSATIIIIIIIIIF